MPRTAETLYHRVKSNLEAKTDDIRLVGEILRYPQDASRLHLVEEITLFVSPRSAIEFDPAELNEFRDQIRVATERSWSMESVWRELLLADGSTTDSLIFPVISYGEQLKSLEDILDPAACMRYLAMEGRVPDFNKFHSTRDVNVCIYPSWHYAYQVHGYQASLLEGEYPDKTMDFLVHDVSREQLNELLDQGRYFRLRNLPPIPELATGRRTGN